VPLSRCEVRDHINYRKNDRRPSYRFYRALQRLKSPTHYICEIFGARDFRVFQQNQKQKPIFKYGKARRGEFRLHAPQNLASASRGNRNSDIERECSRTVKPDIAPLVVTVIGSDGSGKSRR
jgi:hypothetical protein